MERQLEFQYSSEQTSPQGRGAPVPERAGPAQQGGARCSIVATAATTPSFGRSSGTWVGAGRALPEAYGGHGMGYVELCALAEELGRSLAPVPFASTIYQFAEALLVAGEYRAEGESGAADRRRPRNRRHGAPRSKPARSRPGGDKDGGPGRSDLRPKGRLVVDGMTADYAVVLARDEAGCDGLYLVDLRGTGRRARVRLHPWIPVAAQPSCASTALRKPP